MGSREGSKEIQAAIKNIMGLELLERGMNHLKDVQKTFSKELEEFGSEEIQELLKKKRRLEETLNGKNEIRSTILANIDSLQKQKEAFEEQLRKHEATETLQKEKDSLVVRKAEIQKDISQKEAEIRELCSKRGFLAFTKPLVDKISEELEQRRVKGEIPSGIKQQFVQDLLDMGQCICSRGLDVGTEPYESVRGWLDKSGNKDLEDAFAQTSANVKLLGELREELFTGLKAMRLKLEELFSKLQGVDEQIDQIDARLDGKDNEEINLLRNKCKVIESEIPRKHVALGEIGSQINEINKQIIDVDTDVKKIKVKEGKADLAKRRMNACRESRDIIGEIYTQVAKAVRADCQGKISEIYSRFLKKPYRAILQENYELRIVKAVGGEDRSVALSQGERQVTSLSFIGALVDIARRNEVEKKKFYFGGIYPIVMDSPFGQLDPEHRKNIAEGIPELAPQVVLMVAKQQWTDEIQTALRPRIGREYSLRNFNPQNDPNITYEYTQILEGGYAE
jgi:DNA sulfur modification protein DndD